MAKGTISETAHGAAPARVGVIGECMVELSLAPSAGAAAPGARAATVGFAGDTFNTAVYLKRLAGASAALSYISVVGEDALSEDMLARFREEGLDTSLVGRHPTRVPGLYAIATDATGERSFTYWRDRAAARTLFDPVASADTAPTLDSLADFDLLYFSGITLAILPAGVRERLLERLAQLRAGGVRVAFDSNYRPRLWESVEAARAWTTRAWAGSDIALPSADDERALFGDADTESVRERLRGLGIRRGALKDGAAGARPFEDGAVPGPLERVRHVVDTTAAGDSFNGGFLAAVLAGGDDAAAIGVGHRCACVVVGERGAIVPAARFDRESILGPAARGQGLPLQ